MAPRPPLKQAKRPDPVADVARLPSVRRAPDKLLTGEQFAQEIGRLWTDVQRGFLDIGRRLNEAFAQLDHGEYGALLANLPFERATADKLRKVAMAADAGTLPPDRMPKSYSTAYELLTLSPVERAEAEKRGLIRPDVKRAEIVAFKRSIRSAPTLPALPPPPIASASPASIDDAVARFRSLLESNDPGIRNSALNLLLSLEGRARRHRA